MSSIQTMKFWATVIKSYSDVPGEFVDYFEAYSNQDTAFPYTVFAPPYESGKYKTPAKILFILNDKIVFLEKEKPGITSTTYYFKDIALLETGKELLHSWMKVEASSNGGLVSSTIEYNTSSGEVFMPIIEKIRTSINEFGQSDLSGEQSKFDYLSAISYKFMNYSRGSIHYGEKVVGFVLQQCIRKLFLDLYIKKFYKTITKAHMSILTDKEIILIKETSHAISYGHIWTYIPLHRVEGISTSINKESSTVLMTLHLNHGGQISSIFDLSNKPNLDTLLRDFRDVKKFVHK